MVATAGGGHLVGTLALGVGGLLLRDLLGLFGIETRLLGGPGVGLGLGLRLLLRALGGEPRPLLLGLLRLFDRRDVGFVGRDLLELKLGKARVEAVGMLREEGVERGAVADLQRKLIVAADVGLRIGSARARAGDAARAGAGTSGTSSPPSEP